MPCVSRARTRLTSASFSARAEIVGSAAATLHAREAPRGDGSARQFPTPIACGGGLNEIAAQNGGAQ